MLSLCWHALDHFFFNLSLPFISDVSEHRPQREEGTKERSIIWKYGNGWRVSVVWPLFKGYSGQSSVRRREWVGTMAGTPHADSRDGSPPCPVGGAHSHTCPAQEVKYNISSETHQKTNKWGYRLADFLVFRILSLSRTIVLNHPNFCKLKFSHKSGSCPEKPLTLQITKF